MKPTLRFRTLPTLTATLATLAVSHLMLPHKAQSENTNPNTQTEVSAPKDASGAILSTIEKRLNFPLTLSQRENILSQYHIYLQNQDKENLYRNLATLTNLSIQDLKTTLEKYL